jgi:hypothetical protein
MRSPSRQFRRSIELIGIAILLSLSAAAQTPQSRNADQTTNAGRAESRTQTTGATGNPAGANDFVPLRQPRFAPVAQATFLHDSDRVVGVSENGVAKAYEPDVTAWHHVVEDQFGAMPVIVTWCSLCNTPLVYKSEVDGEKLTFARAGNRGNNFYMADSETGSHWQQIGGECFEGPLKGKRLTMVPFLFTTWGEWRAQHPQTLALIPESAYAEQYAGMAKRIATMPFGSNTAPGRELVRQADTRLPNYEQVIGIESGEAHKAYPAAVLSKQPIINDKVGSTPVVVAYVPSTDTTTAFSRIVNGRTLTFRSAHAGTMTDDETGSTWTTYGECTAGKLKGQKLAQLIPEPGLWFAWAEFHPDTEVYTSGK